MAPKKIPFHEALANAEEWVKQGHTVHQRFACEKCGNDTLGIEKPNTFHKLGKCDKCGHVTDLEKTGCNYLLMTKF